MRARLVGAVWALMMTGCADSSTGLSYVTLSDEAKNLRILEEKEEAAPCKRLGEVVAGPPYIFPHDAKHRLRNEVAARGGNAMLITNHFLGAARAIAYLCPPVASLSEKSAS